MLDHHFLMLCYQLALQNEGNTSPNPSVGAVIVRNHAVISYGYHRCAGAPHAEVEALKAAGSRARGSTLYCTLEPCSHYGKTPPCVDAIQAAGISRVVFSVIDRNPLVSGKGKQELQKRGLDVQQIEIPILSRFYEPYFQSLRAGRPYFIAKVAMTANGMISPADRNSRWITNEMSLAWVHQLRARCDGILVGADTVLLDRPHLTVRAQGISRKPLRIIIDSRFKLTPVNCSLLEDDAPILICGAETAPMGREKIWEGRGVETLRFKNASDLATLLFERGLRKIMIEGGQKIFTLFHTNRLIEEYVLMIAPRLLTGKHSLNLLSGEDQSLSETFRYHLDPVLELDGDVIVRLRNP